VKNFNAGMEFTARKIADFLKGKIEGDPEVIVSGVSKIEDGKPGTLSFLANPKYTQHIYSSQASIILVSKDFTPDKEIPTTLIRVKDPYMSFASLLDLYEQKSNSIGIDKHADVSDKAKIGENVYIGAFSYIGENSRIGNGVKISPNVYISTDVEIGDNTVIYSGVNIHNKSVIGSDCIFHSGVIIGGDGFGFAPHKGNCYTKIPQVGNVIIEDHVEIGSNSTIDRATMGSTIIRKGVKLDNLIQVGHNVEIGENTVIAAQTGISGSTKIGKDCMIGGQVGFVGHLNIADGVKIAAQSGITSDITEKGLVVQGAPAFSFYPYQRSYVLFRKLPELSEKIEMLEKELKQLKNKD